MSFALSNFWFQAEHREEEKGLASQGSRCERSGGGEGGPWGKATAWAGCGAGCDIETSHRPPQDLLPTSQPSTEGRQADPELRAPLAWPQPSRVSTRYTSGRQWTGPGSGACSLRAGQEPPHQRITQEGNRQLPGRWLSWARVRVGPLTSLLPLPTRIAPQGLDTTSVAVLTWEGRRESGERGRGLGEPGRMRQHHGTGRVHLNYVLARYNGCSLLCFHNCPSR